ncbi:MAG: SDR family oxidoreductase [Candidatus Omnitrophica bacterium]|nr:SDR family oxidoreductase [Candidatus Omnitrophota bacterium]
MRYLVTGGAGFIGSHLVERLLRDGHRVTVIDNFSTGRPENLSGQKSHPNLTLIEEDISNLAGIMPHFKGIERVFHVAALADIVPSIVNPLAYYKSNVTGTLCVAEASRLSGVKKLVYAASSSCYGITDVYPTPETAKILPQYPYALTKFLGEQIVLHWAKVYRLPVISLRLFNVYGPRSRTGGTYGAVFGVFLAQKLNHKPFTVVGDGKQTRDFIFVTDVVNAFIRASESDCKDEIFNVGSGNTYSVNSLVEFLGGDVVYIPKRPGEPDCTFADIAKIKAMLRWEPEITLKQGVKILLDNIDFWRSAPVWTPEKIGEATKEWFQYLSG